MILAKKGVYQFTISDFIKLASTIDLDPDNLIISPVFGGSFVKYYLIDKHTWKPMVIVYDNKNYALVVRDTPKYRAGECIVLGNIEPWYKLFLKKVFTCLT